MGEQGPAAGIVLDDVPCSPILPLYHDVPQLLQVATFKRAVTMGDIVWHAAPTDQQAGYFPNAGLFEAGLALNEHLAAGLGVKPSTAVSTRDVPGWTRAAS